MNEEEFLEKMADLLDCEETVKMNTDLLDIEEWDSLSFIGFLAMAQTLYNKKIRPSEVRNANTIADLYNLIK
ncbi:MAG: phosphopantetheine-binding protein [Acidaminococcaceae bacterium]